MSRTRVPPVLGALLVAAALLLAWWAARGAPARSVAPPPAPGVAAPPRPRPIAPVPPLAFERTLLPAEPDRGDPGDGAEPKARADEGPAPPPPLVVTGRVLDAAGSEPVAGAAVTLGRTRGTRDGPRRATATTDPSGGFRLELPHGAWRWHDLCPVGVVGPGNRRMFTGEVVLQPDLVLLARARLVLRGRFETGSDLAEQGAGVSAWVPAHGFYPTAVYAGATGLGPGNRFEIEAYVDATPARFGLVVSDERGALAELLVPARELLSEGGARIPLPLQRLVLRVTDEGLEPLGAAEIRLGATGTRFYGLPTSAVTDAAGRAALILPPGRYELCAGRAGHAFHREIIDVRPGAAQDEHALVLRRLRPQDRIAGLVLDPRDRPLADAFVSAFPRTEDPEVAVASSVHGTSGGNGRFELATGGDLPVEVTASHPDLGLSEAVVTRPGRGEVVLRFAPSADLTVHLEGIPSDAPYRSGGVQYVLLDRRLERHLSGHGWGLPVAIEEVPPGSYNLYVLVEGPALMGQATIEVVAGVDGEVTVPAIRVGWLGGTLVLGDGTPGAGLTVEVLHPAWPPEVVAAWGEARTDERGAFRVLTGMLESVDLVVRAADGEELARLEAVADGAVHVIQAP